MRKYGRTDGNQTDIVESLRKLGFSVEVLSPIGNGVPDLMVGGSNRCPLCRGKANWLIELKNPEQSPSKRRLTAEQLIWRREWKGQVSVCETLDEILKVVTGRKDGG